MDVAIAVDIGGTKLAAGIVDADGGLTGSRSVATPPDADAEELFASLTGLIDSVTSDLGQSANPTVCGVGTGGPMGLGGAWISPLNIGGWRRFPLRDRLAAHCGLDTYVDNDAKALALGEWWQGGARGETDFMAMVVSTGVGGGIVLDGRLLDGADGNAGHIGHVVVEPDGRTCACGAQGCLEAEASGTGIAAATGSPAAEAVTAVRVRTGTLVGRGVASVVNLLDLRLTLVAGSVALGYGDDFFTAAQAELDLRSQIDHGVGARIVPGELGADGPLVGAGAVGWRGLGHRIGVPS